jgi:NAD(P)H-dependent FMN reductase
MPGVLKDAVDYLYDEWSNKAAGFVSYGIDGGVRAVEQMRLVMAEVGIADVRHQVALSLFHDFSDEVPRPNDHAIATLSVMLDEVVAWSRALAPLRAVEVPA